MSNETNSKTIMIRITPTALARVEAVERQTGLKPAAIARMFLLQGLDRPLALLPAEASPKAEDERKSA
jgi:hypothetical protein